jgi:hypothetical protein
VASIVGTGVAALVAVVLSTLVAWMPGEPDWWHVLGAGGWTLMAWTLTGQTVIRHTERQVARDRTRRELERLERQSEAAREARRINTGTWQGDAVGQVLTVRYDPETGQFHAEGWLGDQLQLYPERLWSDRATLVAALSELETTGELEPVDDEGTRAVRARLDLPGPWNEEEPVVTQPMPDEARTEVLEAIRDDLGVQDTRRLTMPHSGPSAAALRPIAVPVFRTEAERAQWAYEHKIPTEVLPLDPRFRQG